MANVLITSEFFGKFSNEAIELLEKNGHNIIDPYGHKFLQPEDIIKVSKDADAFICDLEQINREVIDASPRLKIISRRGVGVDSVDVKYAQEKNIAVARTLGVVEPPVAELVMGYILEFSRNINALSQKMHRGIWERTECHSIEGKKLGIVGMGKIAYEVARRAASFGMSIIYYDIQRNSKVENDFRAEYATLDELLGNADFVTIHAPLTEETDKLFDYDTICKMKKDAFLINTARGAIVDENGLHRALKENKIKGTAIDVFDIEPQTNCILNGLPNVILTPHIGTFTQEIFVKMDVLAAQNVVDMFK